MGKQVAEQSEKWSGSRRIPDMESFSSPNSTGTNPPKDA
jgi:hypothetical protein